MTAVNQTASKIVSDREEQRVCESEDYVQIPFQILAITTVILREGLVTVIYMSVYQSLLVNC